jgi:hypothetical protein
VFVYAGIDEAGYGPILGPLVVARSVFAIHDAVAAGPPPDLWSRLAPLIGRAEDRAALVRVDDSKRLHTGGAGLGALEHGVLALLPEAPGAPATLAAFLAAAAADAASAAITLPWYRDDSGGPALPVAASPEALAAARPLLAAHLAARGVALLEARAAVVFEDRFNSAVLETGNKSLCAWRFVAAHLREIWRLYGEQDPLVVLDRQGGRQFYAEQLERLFPEAACGIAAEAPQGSSYEIRAPGRRMRLEVGSRAESAHLPVAFASMTAKYLRELLMRRFQKFWSEQAPEIRPTAGYHTDGSRFLRELAPRLRSMEVPAGTLVRIC